MIESAVAHWAFLPTSVEADVNYQSSKPSSFVVIAYYVSIALAMIAGLRA
jgi:hypothetical protein